MRPTNPTLSSLSLPVPAYLCPFLEQRPTIRPDSCGRTIPEEDTKKEREKEEEEKKRGEKHRVGSHGGKNAGFVYRPWNSSSVSLPLFGLDNIGAAGTMRL